ncbi:MAG: HD domain-containing phosphohydrolase [Vicinamibacterales bacterium]
MSEVLIVEDEAPIRRLLHRWSDAEGASAVEAESAEQGLLLASTESPAVAFCDINLPRGQSGFWLVEQLHRLHPATCVVVTTGLHQFDAAVTGLRTGAIDYIVKPFTRERFREALRRALAEHQSRKAVLGAAAPCETGGPRDGSTGATEALLSVLRADHEDAVGHARRVSQLAVAIARALNASGADVSDIEHAAILRNITRLDVHALGRHVPFLAAASTISAAVEERFDGKGFPLGLAGDAIPPGARILAVAEAWIDLVGGARHGRLLPDQALAVLRGERAREFDPAVLDALTAVQSDMPSEPTISG